MDTLNPYKIKDNSMLPFAKKGDIVSIKETSCIKLGVLYVVQTRDKTFIGRYLVSPNVGMLCFSVGLDPITRRSIRIGKRKFKFYEVILDDKLM